MEIAIDRWLLIAEINNLSEKQKYVLFYIWLLNIGLTVYMNGTGITNFILLRKVQVLPCRAQIGGGGSDQVLNILGSVWK